MTELRVNINPLNICNKLKLIKSNKATRASYCKSNYHVYREKFNPLTARIFTVFGQSLLEDRALHKEAWVATLLGTHLSIQVHKKVKFS